MRAEELLQMTVPDHLQELLDQPLGGAHLPGLAVERDLVAAHEHLDERELLLDLAEQPVLRAEQPHHGDAVDGHRARLGRCGGVAAGDG
jgi:hypothetical protein